MKKLICLLMAALMVLVAVSCDKNTPGNGNNNGGNGNGQEEIVLPDVISDLVVGDVSIPVKTLTSRHAAVLAGLDGWTDQVLYAEDINDLTFVLSSSLWEEHALCVPLGDKSLQDIYDLLDDKAGYALFVVTDKELDAGQYTFMDEFPVGILPESAMETIESALYKYEGMDSFNISYKTREDLLLPAKPLVGKQWLGMIEGVFQSTIYDLGYTEKDSFLWWGSAQKMPSGFYGIGDPIQTIYFQQPRLPHKIINTGENLRELQSDESGLEVSMVQSDGRTFVLKSLWSFGEHVFVWATTDQSGGTRYIFSPINPPIKGTHRQYDVMLTIGGTDYPVGCDSQSDYEDVFLSMGQDIPFVYLDIVGYPADFQNANVSGKIVGLKRGGIPFSDKQQSAKNAGAIGVICVDNETGFHRPVVEPESIPFGVVVSDAKGALQGCTSVSFTAAHD